MALEQDKRTGLFVPNDPTASVSVHRQASTDPYGIDRDRYGRAVVDSTADKDYAIGNNTGLGDPIANDVQIPSNKPDMVELGGAGLITSRGTIADAASKDLEGVALRRWVRNILEQDATVGAIMFIIEMMIRTVKWSVEPHPDYKDVPQAQDQAQFVEECRMDMDQTWSEVLSEIITFIPYGWSYFEICYKQRGGPFNRDPLLRSNYNDNKIGWRKFAPRPQTTLLAWEIDDHGGIRGLWQQAPPTYVPTFIPIEKALLFRTVSRKGNPEGQSVFRSVKRAITRKWNLEDLEAIGIERDLAGLPVAWLPPEYLRQDATPEQKYIRMQVENIVQNVKRDTQEGIVFPLVRDEQGNKLFDFQLMSASGQRQFNIRGTIDAYKREIAMAVMADFMTMGHEKIGSYAMSNDKTRMFSVALGAWLDSITEVFNTYAIPRLLMVNPGTNLKYAPRLTHSNIEGRDLTALGDYISKLVASGAPILSDVSVVEYLMQVAEIPVPQGGLKLPDPIPAPDPNAVNNNLGNTPLDEAVDPSSDNQNQLPDNTGQ